MHIVFLLIFRNGTEKQQEMPKSGQISVFYHTAVQRTGKPVSELAKICQRNE
jgi:hypothetical protein